MDWSYDELEREVTGSLVYRRFSRIDAGKVPDAKTMVRLGQLLDGGVLKSLLERLVAIAHEAGLLLAPVSQVGDQVGDPTDPPATLESESKDKSA